MANPTYSIMAQPNIQSSIPVDLPAISGSWKQVFRLDESPAVHMAKFDLINRIVRESAAPNSMALLSLKDLDICNIAVCTLPADLLNIVILKVMMVSKSSALLTKLLQWRNPAAEAESKLFFAARAIITEVALVAMPVVALIESVAYGLLSLGTYVLGKKESHEYNVGILKSSSFTIVWSFADLLFYNLFHAKLSTEEWDAWVRLRGVNK